MAVVELESLTKFYGKHRGIVEVSLTVTEGEVFGFLGPNGAGKTTTIRTLLDLIRPTPGDDHCWFCHHTHSVFVRFILVGRARHLKARTSPLLYGILHDPAVYGLKVCFTNRFCRYSCRH